MTISPYVLRFPITKVAFAAVKTRSEHRLPARADDALNERLVNPLLDLNLEISNSRYARFCWASIRSPRTNSTKSTRRWTANGPTSQTSRFSTPRQGRCMVQGARANRPLAAHAPLVRTRAVYCSKSLWEVLRGQRIVRLRSNSTDSMLNVPGVD